MCPVNSNNLTKLKDKDGQNNPLNHENEPISCFIALTNEPKNRPRFFRLRRRKKNAREFPFSSSEIEERVKMTLGIPYKVASCYNYATVGW